MIGQKFLHYEVLDKLGEGSAGVVYKAIDLRLDRIVAVKFLSPGVADSEEQRARLTREARAISALNHPSIATLFDLGMVGSDQFLVLEYLPGGTLGAEITRLSKSGRLLPLSKILDYGGQIASGLEFAHSRGILHRDIKADNVMLTADGNVKITDFGLARLKGIPRLTQAGTPIGTLAYMPPEQFKGEEVDERADIYSFGVVLYEMLTGRLPFHGAHEAALLYSILNEAPPLVSSLRPDVPPGLDDLIMRMLEKDVAARPASIDQLRQLATFPTGGRPLSVSAGETPEHRAISVAVIPFMCLSANEEDQYFADGLTEDLISALAQIRNLYVPARTSSFAFREERDLRTIGYKLNVRHIVEGSFRRAGPLVRITARLVDVPSGYQLWSASYDRDVKDIFSVQVEITRMIAEALRVELSKQMTIASHQTTNMEAYQLCLRGRYYWARRPVGIHNAIIYFKHALDLDPAYPAALIGLADCYNTLGSWENGSEPPRSVMPMGMSYAEKALQFNELSGEAHTCKAYCLFHYRRDWNFAEEEFRRAIELNPNYGAAHHWYSHYLTAMGRTEESLRESRRAIEIDPLDMVINVHLAWHYQLAEQFELAMEQSERSVRMEPGWHWSHFFLGWAYEQKAMLGKAVDELEKSVELSNGHTVMTGALGHAYGIAGDAAKARGVLEQLMAGAKAKYVASYEIGLIHFALGENDQGFHWLDKAVEERSGWLVYMNREPRLKMIRSDPRFPQLLKRIGFSS
jgi:eukaryotic-like serine/threonine-protein kinase